MTRPSVGALTARAIALLAQRDALPLAVWIDRAEDLDAALGLAVRRQAERVAVLGGGAQDMRRLSEGNAARLALAEALSDAREGARG